MVQIINFLQREQTVPLTYMLENTYPGRTCTKAVKDASKLVQGFIGAPLLVDAADVDFAAHRVREYWTNFLARADLQVAMPTLMLPSPPLHLYHIPCRPRHIDRRPFAPTDASLQGEGEVFNFNTEAWEEPDVLEKEMLLGYHRNEKPSHHFTEAHRSIRLGRALDANVMRWMGALLAAAQP